MPTEASPFPLSSRPKRTRISCYATLTNGHVCGFPQRKPHEVRQRHPRRQEIRGSAVERLSVLSSVRGLVWLWKRRGRGPLGKRGCVSHFPPTLRRLGYLRKQNMGRWRLSELLQHV